VTPSSDNRFDDFFADDAYVVLKNHLYNYRLRRRAVRKYLQPEKDDRILEVGSGVSPMTDGSERIVYSEISFTALRKLKRMNEKGFFVVADATRLPFKGGSFSRVVCSEVLEHVPEDQRALHEMALVLESGGSMILTFPHRRAYFAQDDSFVHHFRRYELAEMAANLKKAGLETMDVRKVLGPLEKITMWTVISLIPFLNHFRKGNRADQQGYQSPLARWLIALFGGLNRLYCIPVWLDACLAPQRFSSVLLIRAVRRF
jgi:ubiquinone/menaquinone biosynthesis C-methylase UbiE